MGAVQKGFTLLEMMIVTVIIGVLVAFAVPMYHEYVSAAQVTRAYKEVSALKSIVGVIIARGRQPTENPAAVPSATSLDEYVGHDLRLSSLISAFAITSGTLAPTGQGAYDLTATLGNDASSSIAGVQIVLLRSGTGVWECRILKNSVVGWQDKFAPPSCTVF